MTPSTRTPVTVTPGTLTPGVPGVTPSTVVPGVTPGVPGVTPGTTPSPPIGPPIPPPTGWVFYIGAENGFGDTPSLTVDGKNVISWGPFIARNSPEFYSSGGPNNKPFVKFNGGNGPGSPYMSSQIQVTGRSGRTVFAYVLNRIGAPLTRFLTGNFTSGVNQYIAMGAGTSYFSFEINTINSPNANYTTYGQWMTACWRSAVADQVNIGPVTTKDTFYNGVKSSSTQVLNNTFPDSGNIFQFGRSEFGDTFNDPYWSGRVYALIMYDRALTDDQIRGIDAYFRSTSTPTPPGTVTPGTVTPSGTGVTLGSGEIIPTDVTQGIDYEYPPAAMMSATTTYALTSYGKGTYEASTSSVNIAGMTVNVFDKSSGFNNQWVGRGLYDVNTGQYTGTATTTVGASSIPGEWVQLKLPYRITLSSVQLDRVSIFTNGGIALNCPIEFVVVGSNDGTTWTQISRINITWVTDSVRYTTTGQSPYRFYRVIFTQKSTTAFGFGEGQNVTIGDVRFFGYYGVKSTPTPPSTSTPNINIFSPTPASTPPSTSTPFFSPTPASTPPSTSTPFFTPTPPPPPPGTIDLPKPFNFLRYDVFSSAISSITTDSAGNVYVCGKSSSLTYYDETGAVIRSVSLSGSGLPSFITKFTNTGQFVYSRYIFNRTPSDDMRSVACDSSGNVIVAGVIASGPSYLMGTVGTTSAQFLNAFPYIFKLNPTGENILFLKTITLNNPMTLTDSLNNIYLYGTFSSNMNIITTATATSDKNIDFSTVTSGTKSALVKLTNGGGFQSAIFFYIAGSVSTSVTIQSVDIDVNGNTYVAVTILPGLSTSMTIVNDAKATLGTIPLTSSSTGFICKFNSSGAFQSYVQVSVELTLLKCDPNGNVYACIGNGVQKYNSSLSLVSSSSINTGVYFQSMTVTSTSVYVSGFHNSGSPSFTKSDGTRVTLPSTSTFEGIMVSFDANLAYNYSQLTTASTSAQNTAIAVDSNGNIITGVNYIGTSPVLKSDTGAIIKSVTQPPAGSVGTSSASSLVVKFGNS